MQDANKTKFHWHYVIDSNTKQVIAKYGYECYARDLIKAHPLRKYEYKLGEERKV